MTLRFGRQRGVKNVFLAPSHLMLVASRILFVLSPVSQVLYCQQRFVSVFKRTILGEFSMFYSVIGADISPLAMDCAGR